MGTRQQAVATDGNRFTYTYEDGNVTGLGFYNKRAGLLLSETRLIGNTIGIPVASPRDEPSNGQTQLTRLYFYEPLYNQLCATIEERGNPIDVSGDTNINFTPQNDGTPPSDSDRSRYATITYYDYQKDSETTVEGDAILQAKLGLTGTAIGQLIDFVNAQMSTVLPAGFPMELGDINGEGTGNGTSSDAQHLGNAVKVSQPPALLVGGTTQLREQLFTSNNRGQITTSTDPEGNLTVTVRYPFSDPEGDNLFVTTGGSNQQYGQPKEIHVDADPKDVMSLIGSDGDLIDFIPYDDIPYNVTNDLTRTNTPGVYQDLVTRYEGGTAISSAAGGGGCASCAYDPLGNPLAMTDPRGFTTTYQRNELGEVYRTIGPMPYGFQVETYYDANRNVIRTDTQDFQAQYISSDPSSPDYGHVTPSGTVSPGVANLPMQAGPGGTVHPGWFTNLYVFDLLDQKIEEDIDSTGSTPSSLVTTYTYDPNQNLITVTKPLGNTVEYDYDERDLRIATRVGYDPSNDVDGSVTVSSYDMNGNLRDTIGPAERGTVDNSLTVIIDDAFRSGSALSHTGDWQLENFYDGFDRVIQAVDAVGGTVENTYDPGGRVIAMESDGTVGGATPTDRTGSSNQTLATAETRFDEGGRAYEQQRDVFLATTTIVPSSRTITHTGGGLAINSTANDHTATATLTSGGDMSYVLYRTIYDRARTDHPSDSGQHGRQFRRV